MSAGVEIPIAHPLAERRWAKELDRVASKTGRLRKLGMIGDDKSKSAPFRVKKDLSKGCGYQVTYGLKNHVQGVAIVGDDVAEEREYDIDFDSGYMRINQERFPMKSGGRASDSRVSFDTRAEVRDSIEQWLGVHEEEVLITKVSGSLGCNDWDTIDSTTIAWDGNALSSPSTDRIIRAGALNGLAANQTSSHKFSLDVIDTALKVWGRRNGTTNRRKIVPLHIDGEDVYVLLIDFLADEQIRQTTSGRAYDLLKADLTRGGKKNNPLWEQADWKYRNVLVFVCEELVHFNTYGGGSDGAVRNLFLGQSAAYICNGPGEDGGKSGYIWTERPIDYKNKLGVVAGKIWGVDKCKYSYDASAAAIAGTTVTYEDFGVGVIDTYCSSSDV